MSIEGSDLRINASGDLELDGFGDLDLVSENELLAQHIKVRLENTNPDWFNDAICADLEDLLGLPNEKGTALQGEKMIQDTLLNLVDPADMLVQSVPVDRATIIYFVFIKTDDPEPLGFEVGLALGSSIDVRRIS